MNYFDLKFLVSCGLSGVVWLLLAVGFAAGQTPPPEPENYLLSGFLTCPAPAEGLPRECPFKLHYVNLTQGRTYFMRMESSEFDASLVLEDLFGNQLATGTDCYEEDQYGCIVFRPPTTGSYRLIASSAPPTNDGYYTIMVRELPIVMRVKAALTTDDASRDDCYHQVHEVMLTEGRRYIIDLESREFETYVKLLNSEGAIVAFNDEGTMNRPARIVFEAPRTGTYRLVATSAMPNATGAFTLMVCCDE